MGRSISTVRSGFALFRFMATICDHRQNSAAGLGGDDDDDVS